MNSIDRDFKLCDDFLNASGIRLLGWNEAASRDMVLEYIENLTDMTIFFFLFSKRWYFRLIKTYLYTVLTYIDRHLLQGILVSSLNFAPCLRITPLMLDWFKSSTVL
jgi:hypothetical protein